MEKKKANNPYEEQRKSDALFEQLEQLEKPNVDNDDKDTSKIDVLDEYINW